MPDVLSHHDVAAMDACWRAAHYLSVGQIYLYDNPLLQTPLSKEHVKPRLLGHWGTTLGLNFLYVHLNRHITTYDLKRRVGAGINSRSPKMMPNDGSKPVGVACSTHSALQASSWATLKALPRKFGFTPESIVAAANAQVAQSR